MAQPVNWNPDRYGSVKQVLQFDSVTGTYSLVEQAQNYTGTNYNFTALPKPSGSTTSGSTTSGSTTQAQTTKAFGDVKPHYWEDKGGNGDNQSQQITKTSGKYSSPKQDPQLTGFFEPLAQAFEGKKPPLGTRLKHQFENITGKTEQDWADVDTYIEREKEFESNRNLQAKYGTFQEYNKALDEIQSKQGFISKIAEKTKSAFKTPAMMAMDYVSSKLQSPGQKVRNEFNKTYFSQTTGLLGNGRIAGNPTTNVFAGMNSQSAYGNLNKSATNRISKRNSKETQANLDALNDPARKAAFNAKTEAMEKQQKDHARAETANRHAKDLATGGVAPGASGGNGNKGGGCVVATHAVNAGVFDLSTKRQAIRWCVKNLHRTWWGEAVRKGYRYYGQKAIDQGTVKNHYKEFKNYLAFATGRKRNLKNAWTFLYRTVQFFIKGITI